MMLNMLYLLLGLSVIVSLFGVINTLVLSVFERTRELGMLRAIGMTRRQVRRMIRHESIVTALIGAALGIGVGMFLAAVTTKRCPKYGVVFAVPYGSLATSSGSRCRRDAGRDPARPPCVAAERARGVAIRVAPRATLRPPGRPRLRGLPRLAVPLASRRGQTPRPWERGTRRWSCPRPGRRSCRYRPSCSRRSRSERAPSATSPPASPSAFATPAGVTPRAPARHANLVPPPPQAADVADHVRRVEAVRPVPTRREELSGRREQGLVVAHAQRAAGVALRRRAQGSVRLTAATSIAPTAFAAVGLAQVAAAGHRIR